NLSCVGERTENGKLGPVSHPDALKKQCDFLLIEADGSRGLPLKAPAAHEPVITEGTGLVIAVLGLTGIGKPIAEVCHRPEQVCALLGMRTEDSMTPEAAAMLLMSRNGLRKQVGSRRFAVILNQADGAREQDAGRRIASRLPTEIPCVMTSYREVEG
ncbi:MAG: selenium cofactor biosynthesis protein YqeC, partial [Butyricicoccaceae bacterium]